jgi:multidrug transporter EmrE-like cation transporter
MTPVLMRSMLMVFSASVVGSFGAVFLKIGSAKVNRSLLSFMNRGVIIGVALYLGSSVFYALGLKGGPVSVLYPIVSLGYIWTILWARLFFKEPLTAQKFMGLGLILLGVFFVGLGS